MIKHKSYDAVLRTFPPYIYSYMKFSGLLSVALVLFYAASVASTPFPRIEHSKPDKSNNARFQLIKDPNYQRNGHDAYAKVSRRYKLRNFQERTTDLLVQHWEIWVYFI